MKSALSAIKTYRYSDHSVTVGWFLIIWALFGWSIRHWAFSVGAYFILLGVLRAYTVYLLQVKKGLRERQQQRS